MTTKYTPGPWKVGPGDIYAEGTAASDFDDIVICAIGYAGARSHEYAIVKAHKPEGRANARLIAAAPELVEALRRLLDARDKDVTTGRLQFSSDPEAANTARALLAKIDGEQA